MVALKKLKLKKLKLSVHPLFVVKNPFKFLQTNPQADAWWDVLILFLKKCFLVHPRVNRAKPLTITMV